MFSRSVSRVLLSSYKGFGNSITRNSGKALNLVAPAYSSSSIRFYGSAHPPQNNNKHQKHDAHAHEHEHEHKEGEHHDDHHHEEDVPPEAWMVENADTMALRDDHPGYPYSRLVDETLPKFTLEEVAKHNKREDCWVIIHGKVYNVTSYIDRHPGGLVIMANAGKDSSTLFDRSPMTSNAWVIMRDLHIGYCEQDRRYDGYNRSNRKGSHYLGGFEV
ncbi:hypothetical protein SAMD00019534_063960 [Acytostelium subglobosum LB1]|uniref:hypothetical protein n=1 Tax=Acytostelium subglobosum LB1 TaxID=1410327 RepID=UPI0006451714|nr:hypothetical protein SAMD00019534_063960 [Acytostelium subglobosum LB1]GAM23221.1 hypothetical protein SAMD00019534_063960 [Acytostelium subglobosum LB1]|eukprot:XP_012753670.1 hypothetical protein SAMD00019534_063960 [Acytostelium subglobosum LB1]